MNPRFVPWTFAVVAVVLIGGTWLRSGEPLEPKPTEGQLIAYQSNDSRIWEIWAERDVNGVLDTVRISPDTTLGAYGFSEPIIVGEGANLFCAMLVHKQVKGDSTFILLRRSSDFGETWENMRAIGRSGAIARHLRACYKNGVIHVVWEDCRSGYWRIYYDAVSVS